MQKLVNKIINESVKDADIYQSNGSTWLIFTDNKQWVIELTESKTLWYNYNFFKNLFNYLSLDVVENQDYITKWVEDNIINGVRNTGIHDRNRDKTAIYVLENGVKETKYNQTHQEPKFKDALKNGVILSNLRQYVTKKILDDTIQNGVKETKTPGNGDIRSTIEWMEENKSYSYTKMIDDVIENGVKETRVCNYEDPKTGVIFVKWDVEIRNVIETGIKEVQPLPSQEGNKDWGTYYHGKEDRTKPHTEYVDEAIKTGLIKTFNR
jgi:hypothetical protein